MWLHGNHSFMSIDHEGEEDQRTKLLSKRLKTCKQRFQKRLTTKQANRMMTSIINLSLKAMDITKERYLLIQVLETMRSFLSEPTWVNAEMLGKILEALRTYHLKLETEHVVLDHVTTSQWLSIFSQVSRNLPERVINTHFRTLGHLIMDFISLLSKQDHVMVTLWYHCLQSYMNRLMNHAKNARIKLYGFLDVIDRLTEFPTQLSLLEGLFTAWGKLRLDPSIGTVLLENDAFEKVLVTTGRFHREKDIITRLHGKSTFQKIHALLMQFVFWGWHSSITTENFFIRLMKQLDHLELLKEDVPLKIKVARFFDRRWPIKTQEEFIHATKTLIERYVSCGIHQGTEILTDRFLDEVFVKISPLALEKDETRKDVYLILAWLMKGTWSWEKPIAITWQLIIQNAQDPSAMLNEFIEFLERLNEQPFQAILSENKTYLNLKHEAVITLLRGIIEEHSLDHVTKVTLMAQLLSEVDRIFKDDDRMLIMKNIRNWFANRTDIDATTKVLALMCA